MPTPETSPRSDTKSEFECELRAPASVVAGAPVTLHFRLRKRSPGKAHVLKWRTPLEGLMGNDYRVVRDGAEIAYAGPMVKRGNPNARSYAAIEPGQDLEAEVDLALAYDFTKPGTYAVAFTGHLWDVVPDGGAVPRPLDAHAPSELACEGVTVSVTAKR